MLAEWRTPPIDLKYLSSTQVIAAKHGVAARLAGAMFVPHAATAAARDQDDSEAQSAERKGARQSNYVEAHAVEGAWAGCAIGCQDGAAETSAANKPLRRVRPFDVASKMQHSLV